MDPRCNDIPEFNMYITDFNMYIPIVLLFMMSLSLLYILINFLQGLAARVKVCGGGQCSHVSVCLSLSGSLLIVITCNQLAGDLDK